MVAAITTLTITDAKSGITALSVMVIVTWLKGDTMGNLIDSQAAIDMCMRAEAKTGYDAACLIAQLPSAQPERKKGRWHQRIYIYKKVEMMVCSECGNEFSYDAETGARDYNFCPNCGADMRGEI